MKHAYRRFSYGIICLFTVAVLVICNGFADEKKPSLDESKVAYIQADKAINAVWKQIEKKWKNNPRRLGTLRWKQRHWISYRDYFSGEVVMRDYGIPAEKLKHSVEHWQAMMHMTRERTRILHSIIDADGNSLKLTGQWTDGYGGSLTIVKVNDEQVAFLIDVVRGPTHHLGSLSGLADRNDRIIRFADTQTKPKDKKTPTWLTWIDRGDHLELIEANSQDYCGARAYFGGDYYRVGDLTQAESQRVLNRDREKSKW